MLRRIGSIAAACVLAIATARGGRVVNDGSLGSAAVSHSGNIFIIAPASGKQVGNNLFYSLSMLNLDNGETANFTGPSSVQNVLTRVTGGVSNIDGTLQCSIPGANFLLINPAGIVFGPDSSLNVSGSFAVTTADQVKLADGNVFAALPAATDAILSTAAPAAFGFLSSNPGGITVNGGPITSTGLANQFHPSLNPAPNGSLTVVGGNITINGGELATSGTAPAVIVSVASPGAVKLSNPADVRSFSSLGDVRVRMNGLLGSDAASTGGVDSGPVIVVAGNIRLSSNGEVESRAAFLNLGGQAGTVSVRATNQIDINGSLLESAGGMDSGPITVTAGENVNVRGDGSVESFSTFGNSGPVTATAGKSVNISGGFLESTSSFQDSGPVNVTAAGHVNVGSGLNVPALYASMVVSSGEHNSGPVSVMAGGNVNVAGGSVESSALSALSLSGGNSSSVNVTAARNVNVSNGGIIQSNAGTNSGSVTVTATENVNVSSGGTVESTALAACGPVFVSSVGLVLDGTNSLLPTGIFVTGPIAQGAGANITVKAQALSVMNDASISADSFGATAAGVLDVSVAGTALLADGGSVTARSFLGGSGGVVRFNAGSLTLDGGTISADNNRNATEGGFVKVRADAMTLENGASISATAGGGLSQSLTATLSFDVDSFLVNTANVFLISPTGTRIQLATAPEEQTYADNGAFRRGTPVSGYFSSFLAKDLDGTWRLKVQEPAGTSEPLVTLNKWSLSLGGKTIGVSSRAGSGTNFTVPLNVSGVSAGLTGGLGGDVEVTSAGPLAVVSGSSISAATVGSGPAGNVIVHAPQLTVSGAGSVIESNAGQADNAPQATGDAGSVEVNVAGAAAISAGGQLAVSAPISNAGSISLDDGSVSIDGGAMKANAYLQGGNIVITTPADGVVTILHGDVTGQSGNGGQITIDPALVFIGDDSIINGTSGGHNLTVKIIAGALIVSPDSQILADRPTFVVDTNVAAGLVNLPPMEINNFLSLEPTCEHETPNGFSSFVVTGNGGLPPSPGGWIATFDVLSLTGDHSLSTQP